MKKIISFLIFILTLTHHIKPEEHIYICTGANNNYFPHLLNFIGSLHKINFDSLKELMIFDLGLTSEQRAHLSTIKKAVVCDLEKTHPDILKVFEIPGRKILGWYAWKPGAIHQALQKYPYVLWIDAGTTILRPIDDLMQHVVQNGYFLVTIGMGMENNKFRYPIKWGTTKYVREKFNLDAPENQWILNEEFIMGGLCGTSQNAYNLYLKDWYEASYDLQNFADDGTTPDGWGTGRHDQTYLSILAHTKDLNICMQDYTQKNPTLLKINDLDIPFYITWNRSFICEKTHIYNSRHDIRGYERYIKYK